MSLTFLLIVITPNIPSNDYGLTFLPIINILGSLKFQLTAYIFPQTCSSTHIDVNKLKVLKYFLGSKKNLSSP